MLCSMPLNQVEDMFSEMSVKPVAAASLGQVCWSSAQSYPQDVLLLFWALGSNHLLSEVSDLKLVIVGR